MAANHMQPGAIEFPHIYERICRSSGHVSNGAEKDEKCIDCGYRFEPPPPPPPEPIIPKEAPL